MGLEWFWLWFGLVWFGLGWHGGWMMRMGMGMGTMDRGSWAMAKKHN